MSDNIIKLQIPDGFTADEIKITLKKCNKPKPTNLFRLKPVRDEELLTQEQVYSKFLGGN